LTFTRAEVQGKASATKGAEASIEFEGTGAIIVGSLFPEGGKADVYLDGRLDRAVESYPGEDSAKLSDSVWHSFGLADGKHTLRLVVRGEAAAGSKGAEVLIEDLVTFR
jgi:hypothetical protein